MGGQHAGAIAGMDAGLFNVLHDAGDEDVLLIGEGIHIDFGGVFEETVDQDWAILREGHRLTHVLADGVLIVGDYHGSAPEHVAGPDEHGIAKPAGDFASLIGAGGRAVRWRGNPQVVEKRSEELSVFS